MLKQFRCGSKCNLWLSGWRIDWQTLLSVCLSDSQQLDVGSLQSIPESPRARETSPGNPEHVAWEPDAPGGRCEEYALLKGLSKRVHEVRTGL